MPPRRRASGPGAKSQQSTLAFHGAANRVTKAGTRTQNAKNIVSEAETKARKPDVVAVLPAEKEVVEEEAEPTTAEAAIIDQTEKEISTIQQADSTPEEDEARKVTAARIKRYWDSKEKERVAPRLHQQDLTLHEKILREWDMSGQYGPCTGIARLKRWKRAHRLDLDPPIEVLAVLLKELDSDKDKVAVQRSHVDELLNSCSETLDA